MQLRNLALRPRKLEKRRAARDYLYVCNSTSLASGKLEHKVNERR